jgi:hypothetical protein
VYENSILAPRIHGELKLGFEVAQSSVAKYMVKRCGPPSQGWRTFLRNRLEKSVSGLGPALDRNASVSAAEVIGRVVQHDQTSRPCRLDRDPSRATEMRSSQGSQPRC